MTKQVKVIPYNPNWPEFFKVEADQIKRALTDNCIGIFHVGSTSVPGLAAKSTIDIIAAVKNPEAAIEQLKGIGFAFRGEYNIPMHFGFSKHGQIEVNLHVYKKGNPEIELNLTFRDYLRNNPKIRDAYATLKFDLLKKIASFDKNGRMFNGYTFGKDAFIRKVLKQAGYNRLRFVFCTHDNEWDKAKELRQRHFFDNVSIADPYEWTFHHPDHVHFILYKGVKIIGYAHIQLWPSSRAAIRIFVVEPNYRHQGFGKQFLEWIESWLKFKEYQRVHTESSPAAVEFFTCLGYTKIPFNDPDGNTGSLRDTPMGKYL